MAKAKQKFKIASKRNPLRGALLATVAAIGLLGPSGCGEYDQDTDQDVDQTIYVEDAAEHVAPQLPSLTEEMSDADKESLDTISENLGPNYILRDLTEGEHTLLNTVFGNEIDTQDLYLVFYNKKEDEREFAAHIAANMPNFLIFLNPALMSEDYSTTEDAAQFSMFIKLATYAARYHEGDFWAHSRGFMNENFLQDSHRYALFLNSDGTPSEHRHFGNTSNGGYGFEHYSVEQQVLMLSDYMSRFAHPSARAPVLAESYGHNRCSAEDQLADLIEMRFHGIDELREQNWGATARELTDAELHFAGSIFGHEFSFDNTWVNHQRRDCTDVVASVQMSNRIDFWGDDDNIADFVAAAAKQTDEAQYDIAVLAHELVHIWQLRTNYKYTNGNADRHSALYNYTLGANKDFTDYNDEQQGAIIQDYVGAFLTDRGKPYYQDESENTLNALKRVVERQFPQAGLTRLYYEQHGVLPPPQNRTAPTVPATPNNTGV